MFLAAGPTQRHEVAVCLGSVRQAFMAVDEWSR
jgi:hypothetical protein